MLLIKRQPIDWQGTRWSHGYLHHQITVLVINHLRPPYLSYSHLPNVPPTTNIKLVVSYEKTHTDFLGIFSQSSILVASHLNFFRASHKDFFFACKTYYLLILSLYLAFVSLFLRVPLEVGSRNIMISKSTVQTVGADLNFPRFRLAF